MGNKVYAEAFGIMCGLADLKIDFQSIDPVMLPDGTIDENKTTEVRVSLSLPVAKDLAKRLIRAVEEYEANFCPVLDMEETQEKIEAMQQK